MWKNADFKEMFANYRPSPPESVWINISNHLNKDESKDKVFWGFNKTQKFTLLVATLTSIVLSAFMFKTIEEHKNDETTEITQITPPIITPENTEKSLIIEKVKPFLNASQNKPTIVASLFNRNMKLSNEEKKSNSQLNSIEKLPEELKPFKKEFEELAELDKTIEILAFSIAKDEINQLSYETHYQKPILNSRYTDKPNLSEFENYLSLLKKENTLELKPNNNLDTSPSILAKILARTYLTPFFGGNFTQISYQGSTNSPYFSENASFTGKLGYNFGFQLGYQFSKNWSIESGLSFGQYIQSFKENMNNNMVERKGIMYIDQIDLPLLTRYSIPFGGEEYPKIISFKAGLIYNSVIKYQVNYTERSLVTVPPNTFDKVYNFDADKRYYNSLQLGYALGLDFDAFLSKKISLNMSMLNSLVSQLENFPTLNNDVRRPKQFSTTFSIGTKIRF